jgi:glycosyltransferase involved in cell wall biosynthesis
VLLPKLKDQTIKNYEIIFCDNESQDNTLQILNHYRIKKIYKFNYYLPGKILNFAAKKASGKYICILSSHCIPVSNKWLEEHIQSIEKKEKCIASFGKQIPLPGSSAQDLIDLDIIFKNQEIIYKQDPYLNNANSIYKSNFLKKIPFDNNLTNIEDREWAHRVSKKGYEIIYNPKSEVFHLHGIHHHENKTNRSLKTYNIQVKKYLEYWKNCNFLKKENFKFILIINARREFNSIYYQKKINYTLNEVKKINNILSKIIVISNIKYSQNKFKFLQPKKNLKEDLINIQKKFNKDLIKVSYLIYINLSNKINIKNLEKLIDETIYFSRESSCFGKTLKKNFLVHYENKETYKSINLIKSEEKPKITILELSKGVVSDIGYLRDGNLITNKTYIECK